VADLVRGHRRGNMWAVSPWEVLFVPASLALVYSLLFVVSWFEQRVLSPRSLILHSARSRGTRPEHVEALVAEQSQRLLEDMLEEAPPEPERRPT
jgi:hypothetical protein